MILQIFEIYSLKTLYSFDSTHSGYFVGASNLSFVAFATRISSFDSAIMSVATTVAAVRISSSTTCSTFNTFNIIAAKHIISKLALAVTDLLLVATGFKKQSHLV